MILFFFRGTQLLVRWIRQGEKLQMKQIGQMHQRSYGSGLPMDAWTLIDVLFVTVVSDRILANMAILDIGK
jgi:hypothetical protein